MSNKLIQKIFAILANLGLLLLVFLIGYISWLEYHRKAPEDLSLILSPDTNWVKSQQPIYFIMGKTLGKINADGTGVDFFYKNDSPLKEFVFSPDGNYILLISDSELLLYNRVENSLDVIDGLGPVVEEGEGQGLIRNPQWSADSKRFCYEIYRWGIAVSDQLYVYDISEEKKYLVRGFLAGVQQFFWDTDGKNLYFYRSKLTNAQADKPYMAKIYQVKDPVENPELVRTVWSKEMALTPEELKSFGINIYSNNDKNHSTQLGQKEFSLESPHGKKLGVEGEYLYYENPQSRHQRLFNMQKLAAPILHIRWLPDERYVVMTHPDLGLLIMDPVTMQIGKLISGGVFGWYQKP